MNVEVSREARAAVHAALGDTGRLAVVDALAAGDASPGELAAQLGLGSNLLAHHLNVLEQAGVVHRLRSDGDRRRTYVTLVPETLPGLTIGAERSAPRVVFVCTRNAARSQLASALWSRHSRIPALSAGTHPAARVNPSALAAARRHGMRMRGRRPRHLDDVTHRDDLIVAVCDRAHEELGSRERLHWSIPDPSRIGTDTAFDTAIDRLSARISRLAAILHPATPADTTARTTVESS